VYNNLKQDDKIIKYKSGGELHIPKIFNQSNSEKPDNIKSYSNLAKQFGAKYKLLNIGQETKKKNPDAFNIDKKYYSDNKSPRTENIKNAIQNSIKSASNQKVKEVIINLHNKVSMQEVWRGFKASLQGTRAKNLEIIIIQLPNGEYKVYNVDKLRVLFNKKER
jgi:hypothetical protein